MRKIKYIVPVGDNFTIETQNVDPELAVKAGPQLVVPVTNARYALNAANARWGSLYDALYGTDVIPGNKGKDFNEDRAKKVIAYVRNFLDEAAPLINASWNEISEIKNIVDTIQQHQRFSMAQFVGEAIAQIDQWKLP